MKKKTISGIFALALLVTTGYGVSKNVKSNADLSMLAFSNVEALADGETNPLCPNGCVSDGDWCYCHYIFENLREYNWGN